MDNRFKSITDELKNTRSLTKEQFAYLLECGDKDDLEYLYAAARSIWKISSVRRMFLNRFSIRKST